MKLTVSSKANMLKTLVILYIITLAVVLGACDKKNEEPVTPVVETQTTKDEAVAQSEYDDLTMMCEEAIDSVQNNVYEISIGECALLTADTVNHVITIDFGIDGCTGIDGKTRKGSVVINYIGSYPSPGSQMTVSVNNYTVDGTMVAGVLSVSTITRNNQGNLEFTTSLTNGKLTYPDGSYITWNSQRTREWVAGEGSSVAIDDVFEITGSSNGRSSNGISFSTTITDPVTLKSECWASRIIYPSSGEKRITPEGSPERIINFGTGTCDKEISLTVAGILYSITLP